MSKRDAQRDAIAQRMMEIEQYNAITGAGAPMPRPDPRGEDFRAGQRRMGEIDDYNRITGGGAGGLGPDGVPIGYESDGTPNPQSMPGMGAPPPIGVDEEDEELKGY